MRNKYTKLLLVLLLILLSKSFVCAQYIYPITDGWGVGINIGLNYFYGDVSDDKGRIWNNTPLSGFYYTDKNIMGGLSLSKTISKIWGVRGNFRFGNLSGSDERTNMYFKGKLYSFDVDATFQYIDYFIIRPESSKFKYYAFLGVGLTNFNSIRRDISSNIFQNAEGYNYKGEVTNYITEATLKLGLGIAYRLDKEWSFNFETTLNYINTDDLDAYRSSSSKLEGYGYMSLGVVYKFDFNIYKGNDLWKQSGGTNNRPHNSGLDNKRKRKLHNKWKR